MDFLWKRINLNHVFSWELLLLLLFKLSFVVLLYFLPQFKIQVYITFGLSLQYPVSCSQPGDWRQITNELTSCLLFTYSYSMTFSFKVVFSICYLYALYLLYSLKTTRHFLFFLECVFFYYVWCENVAVLSFEFCVLDSGWMRILFCS